MTPLCPGSLEQPYRARDMGSSPTPIHPNIERYSDLRHTLCLGRPTWVSSLVLGGVPPSCSRRSVSDSRLEAVGPRKS